MTTGSGAAEHPGSEAYMAAQIAAQTKPPPQQRPQPVDLRPFVESYLAHGLYIIPTIRGKKQPKEPWKGLPRPTIEQWSQWLERWPTSACIGIGCVLGLSNAPEGKQLVDVEPDDDIAREWFEEQTPQPRGWRAASARSIHTFAYAPTERKMLAAKPAKEAGLPEVRAGLNITVLPPSWHRTGAVYRWLPGMGPGEVQIVDAPAWAVEIMPLRNPPRAASKIQPRTSDANTAYGLAALNSEVEAFAAALSGSGRNPQLNDAAFALGQLVSGGELVEADVRRALLAACETNGLVAKDTLQKCEDTLNSGLTAGMRNPRSAPEATPRPAREAKASPADPLADDPGEQERTASLTASVGQIAAADLRLRADDQRLLSFPRTDAGNAEALAVFYGDRLRFDHARQRWLVFDGDLWTPDRSGEIVRLCKEIARRKHIAAQKLDDDAARGKAMEWARKTESRNAIEATIALARAENPIADTGDGWNPDPLLLGVANGVVDLRDATLRRGRQEDRITQAVAVAYNSEAEAPRWYRFLDEVFDGDNDLIAFVQRACGYSLTGSQREQCFFLPWGQGANGKTVLLQAALHVAGTYGLEVPFAVFDRSARNDHPTALADFEGKRLVVASESIESLTLNEGRIKALTGGEQIKARHMRQDFRQFESTGKLWLCSNHRPRVSDTSEGFWRRALLIPFVRQFTGEAADRDLPHKLRDEAEGILTWQIQGAAIWYTHGLQPPANVLAASREWQEESDPIGDFLASCCEVRAGRSAHGAELYAAYSRCCDREQVPAKERLTSTALGTRLTQRFTKRRTSAGTLYHGIGLCEQTTLAVGGM